MRELSSLYWWVIGAIALTVSISLLVFGIEALFSETLRDYVVSVIQAISAIPFNKRIIAFFSGMACLVIGAVCLFLSKYRIKIRLEERD